VQDRRWVSLKVLLQGNLHLASRTRAPNFQNPILIDKAVNASIWSCGILQRWDASSHLVPNGLGGDKVGTVSIKHQSTNINSLDSIKA
jgi:hypothetical protein